MWQKSPQTILFLNFTFLIHSNHSISYVYYYFQWTILFPYMYLPWSILTILFFNYIFLDQSEPFCFLICIFLDPFLPFCFLTISSLISPTILFPYMYLPWSILISHHSVFLTISSLISLNHSVFLYMSSLIPSHHSVSLYVSSLIHSHNFFFKLYLPWSVWTILFSYMYLP